MATATTTTSTVAAPPTSDPQIVARLASKRDKWKGQAQSLTTERDALKIERDRLLKENEDLKKKADTSASARRVQELEGKLLETEHRKVFDRVAKAAGVPEDSLDLVYQQTGYKPEGEPDEATIGASIEEAKSKPGVSRLFGSTETTTPTGTPPPLIKPGPGSDRGSRLPTPASAKFSGADDPKLSDVKYIMNNYEEVTKAAQERIARGEI